MNRQIKLQHEIGSRTDPRPPVSSVLFLPSHQLFTVILPVLGIRIGVGWTYILPSADLDWDQR
jgi:hypothetical protein